MSKENIGNALFKAQLSKCVAERDEAIAILETLFNRSVGIGEHTDLLAEVNKYNDQLANAIDKIQVLTNVFGESETEGEVAPKVPQEQASASSEGGI
tara:strand:+ start:193 stop:483 length:291 start_codon:yes stop_codon:yes gene_type:complete